MVHHEGAIERRMDVELDTVRAERDGPAERGERILERVGGGAAVGDHLDGHGPIIPRLNGGRLTTSPPTE